MGESYSVVPDATSDLLVHLLADASVDSILGSMNGATGNAVT